MTSPNSSPRREPARYEHDCTSCQFMGSAGSADLYVCVSSGSLVARSSSDGPDYRSVPIGHMYLEAVFQEAFARACAEGAIVATSRDRVLCALFAPFGDDRAGRQSFAGAALSSLERAFDPDRWDAALSIVTQGGVDFLREAALSRELLLASAFKRAVRLGVSSLDEFRLVASDPGLYLRENEAPVFPHEANCSAFGDPQWACVDDCGPCDRAAEERAAALTVSGRSRDPRIQRLPRAGLSSAGGAELVL